MTAHPKSFDISELGVKSAARYYALFFSALQSWWEKLQMKHRAFFVFNTFIH